MKENTMSSILRVSVRRVSRRGDDRGVALIFVIFVIMMMAALTTTSLAYALQGQPKAKHDQNWTAALSAAQAGVDDYVSRLNKSDSYSVTVDCSNLALKGPKAATNSCIPVWDSSTAAGWENVDATAATAGKFHYDVDTSSLARNGSVLLNSTGRVNGTSRTIQVRVSRGGSTDFLYYTDFEDADPANTVTYPSTPSADCGGTGPTLAKYWYQGRSGCGEIQFAGTDVLDGRAHFNDTPRMSSQPSGRPRFLQGYETADPNCTAALGAGDASGNATSAGLNKCWRVNTSSPANPYVGAAGAISAPKLLLPDNSGAFINFPGCVYTGDTRIKFKSDGTMDVWNTGSSGTLLTGPGTPGGTNCGNAPTFVAGSNNAPTAKQNVPVPNDMVIYVKNSGSSAVCTPGEIVNGSGSGSTGTDIIPIGTSGSTSGVPNTADQTSTTGNYVSDVTFFNPFSLVTTYTQSWTKPGSSWVRSTSPAPVVAPFAPGSTPADSHQSTFDCGQGNVYVEGTVKGRLTIAAQNNIIVTGDLLIDGATAGAPAAGTSLIGLVASNSVAVLHPVTRNMGDKTGPVVARTAGGTATCPATQNGNPTSSGSNLTCTFTYTRTADTSNPYNDTYAAGANRYIYASIQTLAHSFWVHAFDKGNDLGNLVVRGSIAQKWRGAVGTGGGTGFIKDYGYDSRLQFASPPYFPQWSNAVWGAKTTGELKPQYKSG
jgi:Tfp pilus assembly protein PilX